MLTVDQPGWIEKDRPECGGVDAIIRPLVLAPCSSDCHVLHGGAGPKENMILGHECVGEVVEVGRRVTRVKPGDTVVVPCVTPNWMSPDVQGRYNAHDAHAMGGFKFTSSKDGTMAEFFHVNHADANLVPLPDGVSMEAALMTVDMMSTGFHVVDGAEIEFGDVVVVMGIGPVGLMAVAGAVLAGASRILAIGTRPNCVEVAKSYGATDIVSYKDGDTVEQILELTGGGADAVIVAGGGEDSFHQAIAMTKAGGRISNVNFYDVEDVLSVPATLWGLGMADKKIHGGFCPGGALRISKMLKMIHYGRVDTTKLISHRFYGFDAIEEAFHTMDTKPRDLIKPIVYCDDVIR